MEVVVIGFVVLCVVAGLFVLGLAALYLWTRRSERDIEIPQRELTDEEKRTGAVQRAAAVNLTGGFGGGAGGI